MSRNASLGLGIVAIIIVGVIAYAMNTSAPGMPSPAATAYGTTTLPSGSNTSDAALSSDFKSVDSQMSGFSSDNAAASQSVSAEQSATPQ